MTYPFLEFVDCRKSHIPLSQLYSYQNCRCFYCNRYIAYAPHTKNSKGFSIDHLFPRSKGFGKNGNIVLACRRCNEKKADRLPTVCEIARAWELYQKLNRKFIVKMTLG